VRFAKNAGNSGGGGGPAGERGGGEREPGGDEVLVVGHNGLEQEHQEHEEVAAGEWRERGVWGEVSRRESQNWKAPWLQFENYKPKLCVVTQLIFCRWLISTILPQRATCLMSAPRPSCLPVASISFPLSCPFVFINIHSPVHRLVFPVLS
jgi:hypothetical protein